ncbi:MAG: hypothetical protein U9R73_00600 [Pseudomonadota bacterium]|nr:hypothetical protein [Pseudomonadota bacterium]
MTARRVPAPFPRLTEAMIRAASMAHYGSDNIDGIDLTVADTNYSFRDAFERMWDGARNAHCAVHTASETEQMGELIRAATNAVRWLGKAVADDAFAKCVNPRAAKVDLYALEAILAEIKGSAKS